MPLWLDLLRTPMAAPETRGLRRLRRCWQTLCLMSALGAGFAGPIHRAGGRPAAATLALLLIATVVCTAIYWIKKQRADQRFLEAMGGGE